MAHLEQQWQRYRLFITALAGGLFVLALVTSFRSFGLSSDGNGFIAAPSRLYVTREIPAIPTSSGKETPTVDTRSPNAIQVGDLLLRIDNTRVKDAAEVAQKLEALGSDASIEVQVMRPRDMDRLSFRVARTALAPELVREIPSSLLVRYVEPGGASDRAGMKVGDLIVKMNSRDLPDTGSGDQILQQARVGQTLPYEIIRDNRTLTLSVIVDRTGWTSAGVGFMLCGFLFMAVGSWVALSRTSLTAARLVGLSLLLLGYTLMNLIPDRRLGDLYFVSTLVNIATLTLGTALWIHSTSYFPLERADILARRWMRYVPAALGGVCLLLSMWVGLRSSIDAGYFISLAGTISMLLIHFMIQVVTFRKRTEELKRINRVLIWPIGLFLLFFFLMFLLPSSLFRGGAVLMFLSLASIPATYVYVIRRYHLLERVLLED